MYLTCSWAWLHVCAGLVHVLAQSREQRVLDSLFFFFQAEDGIRDLVRSRGLGDVYKRQEHQRGHRGHGQHRPGDHPGRRAEPPLDAGVEHALSLIHI